MIDGPVCRAETLRANSRKDPVEFTRLMDQVAEKRCFSVSQRPLACSEEDDDHSKAIDDLRQDRKKTRSRTDTQEGSPGLNDGC